MYGRVRFYVCVCVFVGTLACECVCMHTLEHLLQLEVGGLTHEPPNQTYLDSNSRVSLSLRDREAISVAW